VVDSTDQDWDRDCDADYDGDVDSFDQSAFNKSYNAAGTSVVVVNRAWSPTGNPYGFSGRRLDPETGLMHYRYRAYHPTLKVFLQRDPLGYVDGPNLYQYVVGNPLRYVDPWGLDESTPVWISPPPSCMDRFFGWDGFWDWATALAPFVNGARDIDEVWSGEDYITGEKLAGWERGVTVVAAVGGGSGAGYRKGIKKATEAISGFFGRVFKKKVVKEGTKKGAEEVVEEAVEKTAEAAGGAAKSTKAARKKGVREFWKRERERLQRGEKGSRDWSPQQKQDILDGRVPKDATGKSIEGHHVDSVKDHPGRAADPSNIVPKTFEEHRGKGTGIHSKP